MLSRLVRRNVQTLPMLARAVQTTPALSNNTEDVPIYSKLSKLPRPVRPEYAPPCRMIFIPDSWFQAFYPKTGVSGPYAFMFTAAVYLLSKEIFVIEHEFYNGISLMIIAVYVYRKYGQAIYDYLNKEVDKQVALYEDVRNMNIQSYKDSNDQMNKEISSLDGQRMIMDIKKENIKMQLEAAYRERLAHVYKEVKKRLDYQLHIQNIERRITQKYMVDWVIDSVIKSITPDQEKAMLQQCIKDLEALAVRA